MRVLVLCDGGGSIGVGHVIRSLALAEASVAAGHSVVVAGHFDGPFVQGQLEGAPGEVVHLDRPLAAGDLQPVIDLVLRSRPDVLHVDSYDAPARLGELVGDVLVSNVEDGVFGRRQADVVIDPTFGAERSHRVDDGSTWLLRGSRYAPVRQRVLAARSRLVGEMDAVAGGQSGLQASDSAGDLAGEAARSVLVVMGGTDPLGLAPAAVRLLVGTGLVLDATVIAVGETAERARAAAEGSRVSLSILAPVDDLAATMARQDLVISAAGTSVWELCCIGVPMALVWAVDNQREGYERVVAAGAALGLGGPELGGPELGGPKMGGPEQRGTDPDPDGRAVGLLRTALTDSRARADLVLAGRQVVDGLGAWRVVRTWEQVLRDMPALVDPGLAARPATMHDARLLWQWRNDPVTRAASLSSEEVSWDDHLGWLAESLTRTDRMLLVVEDPVSSGGSVGTVRWDLRLLSQGVREWEVSITVAPERRGRSLARPLLRAGEVMLAEAARSSATGVTAYLAVVHIENGASLRLFETSGYVPDAPPDQRGFMRFRKTARVP
jgi:spore coat polysaccharide biosynthesis predicted glycosyltransferase SpsG/RimJ/RimL family protein N-acetyltransferase